MMRRPAFTKTREQSRVSNSASMGAPILGWNTRDPRPLMKPGYAIVLDNVFPKAGEVQLRYGRTAHLTGTNPVKSLMSWESPTSSKLFAACDSGIYDATSAGAVGASVATITNGLCQWVNFRTSGASYLVIVNGTDDLQLYNGTAWSTDAAIAIDAGSGGGNLNTNTISSLCVFKRRLFFVKKDSLDFYYLPVDSIGGTDSVFLYPLGGIFPKGGYLVAMASWTVDSGAGSDDLAVFVTSKGQAAVYTGTDPSDATKWALQGVYDLAEPLGKNCLHKFGGDLLYLSRSGLFPLSKALQDTRIKWAISDIIRPTFTDSAATYGGNDGWAMVSDAPNSLLLVNVPTVEGSESVQYVMNTNTMAWCRFTNWPALSWVYHNGQLYMGTASGVSKAYSGADDAGANIVGLVRTHFDYFDRRGMNKNWKLFRAHLEVSDVGVSVEFGLDVDFADSTVYEPALEFELGSAVWGDDGVTTASDSLYDTAEWAEETDQVAQWFSIAADMGYCGAVRLRITGESATVSWSAIDVIFEEAEVL